jgi:hypothetical protein
MAESSTLQGSIASLVYSQSLGGELIRYGVGFSIFHEALSSLDLAQV